MARKAFLSDDEMTKIVQMLKEGKTTLEISKTLARDHRTIKKFVSNPGACSTRTDKGKTRGCLSLTRRRETRLKKEIRKHPQKK